MKRSSDVGAGAVLCLLLALLPGCSMKKMAVNSLGNALAEGGSVYATDDDPELVGQAVPFGLKTMEALLQESPRHKGLLFAAAAGFTQYAFSYVQVEADYVEDDDFTRAREQRLRARNLYLRARDYGLRGLDAYFPRFLQRLRQDAGEILARARKKHVRLLYWTGLAWFGAIAVDKSDPELTADQSVAESLLRRALELDPGWDYGSIHEFYIAWEGRGEAVGGSFERAREHFEQAVHFSRGQRVSPFVTMAENVAVAQQSRGHFQELLRKALDVDTDAVPELRLANLVYQKRARWLLARIDDLFVE